MLLILWKKKMKKKRWKNSKSVFYEWWKPKNLNVINGLNGKKEAKKKMLIEEKDNTKKCDEEVEKN